MTRLSGMVLAAGRGSRLGRLGSVRPKCLVDLGGGPLLGRILSGLRSCGCTRVVINLHHLSRQVVDYVESLDGGKGFDIRFSSEDRLLDTGGAVRYAVSQGLLPGDGDALLHNGDIYCEVNLSELVRAHRGRSSSVTILTREGTDGRGFLFDDRNRLKAWHDRHSGATRGTDDLSGLHFRCFCGISVVSPSFLDIISRMPERFSLVDAFLACVDAGLPVTSHHLPRDLGFFDIGTPEAILAARRHLSSRARKGERPIEPRT